MNESPIFSDDDPLSMPSMPTMRGGDPDTLGRIDHYDLLRKLGGGGFGVVYLVRDTASGVEVAIKTLHPLLKRNAEEMDLLREKFALVSRLAHPNIATALVLHPVRDIHVWDDAARAELKLSPGDSVMVMRYAPGVTLSKWRRQFPDGVVPPDLALEIGHQVAAALDYAHGELIVHRDIKPGNIMVETLEGGRVRARILDFGLAAEIRSSMSRVSTEQGDTSGTRPYMAPEQWLGKKQDGRTDEYALACVLYELLSGAPPFAGVFETGDPMIMMATVKGETPDEIEDAAPAVNAALLRALAKAPKERFPSCAAFVAALTSTTEDPEGRDGSTSRPPDGRAVGASLPETAGGASEQPPTVEDEATLLLRKAALKDALAAISETDRADKEFGPLANEASHAFAAVEEALQSGRPAVAAICLDRADAALARLGEARRVREETEFRQREEEARRREKERQRRLLEEEVQRRHEQEEKRRQHEEEVRRTREQLISRLLGQRCLHEEEERHRHEPEEKRRQHEEEMKRTRELLIPSLLKNMVPIPGKNYRMSKYEVTQVQWESVMGKNLSRFKGEENPVERVTWNDCQAFLERLNMLPAAKASGLVFRLPTETEWEFAARAGATGDFCKLADGTEITKDTLAEVAWFDDYYSSGTTLPVGLKQPNAFGLYDMHGNVWEWTSTADGERRVIRGGSWKLPARFCKSSFRNPEWPSCRGDDLGFRLAASGRTAAK